MAEVVGIAAAAVQFIELSTKLLIAASKLRSKLENAPEKVKTSERSVRQLVSLVRKLEADLQPTSSTTLANVLTDESKLEAEHILEDCSKEASALLDLLHGFMIKADESFLKGKMRAFSYVKKEDEVAERCKRLDELSSRLVLWYHHQTLSLQKKQLDALFSTNSAINTIGSQIHAGLAAVTHSLQQQQGAMVLTPSPSTTRIDSSVTLHRRPRRSGLENCTCKLSHLRKSTYNVGPVSLISKQSGVHKRNCLYHGKIQTRDSRITISFSLPWLLSQRVQLSLASSYDKGAYSISPIIRTVNIVDGQISPAFNHLLSATSRTIHLFDARWDNKFDYAINTSLISPLQEILETLVVELEEDFRSGVSSAMDVTSDGKSMLHCLFQILGMISAYEDYFAELAASLLQLLIEFGVDINAESPISFSGTPKGENALFLLTAIMDIEYIKRKEDTSLQLMNMLYRTGIDVPGWKDRTNLPFLEPYLFPKLPDLALEVEFPKLTFAVISRDEHKLRALIQAQHDVDERYIPSFTPLCYCLGWPEGCGILLESGADPNAALLTAFAHLDVAMVKQLLGAGCALFANNSPLRQFFWTTRLFTSSKNKISEILSLVINAMADFRRQLMRLACENVPRQALIQRGWTNPSINSPLLDDSTAEVVELLDNLKIQIPRNLHPGFKRSVYHENYLTTEAAQLLYSCGFMDIDLPDRNGCTPSMLCLIRIGRYENEDFRKIPISWFLNRGISILYCSSIPGFNLLHLLSACYQSGLFSHTLSLQRPAQEFGDLHTVVQRLSRLCNPYSRDLCKCWCSSSGCLPLTLLFKGLWPRWTYYQYLGSLKERCTSWDVINQTLKDWICWYGCDPADQTILEGICRIEVFQRLGMAHTCCKLKFPWDPELYCNKLSASFVSDPERQQMQEEDTCSKVQLDALLDTYTALFTKYSDSVARLWTAWWEILEDYLPQRVWILEKDDYGWAKYYVELENPWCNTDLPDPQDLWTKTDEIKRRVTAAMAEPESPTLPS